VSSVEALVEDLHRREWAAVLAATTRVARDLDLAEECVQEAYVQALERWTRDGVPGNPAGWLVTAAKRRALDAIRHAEVVRQKLPLLLEPDVRGLLALLLVLQARSATRTDPTGRLLRLEEQDRSRWNPALIEEGRALVLAGLTPGRYLLPAAIAALHAEAPSYEETDWAQIVTLYDALLVVWPSPVVALNRAVAVSMAHGPAAALGVVEALEGDARLAGYRYLPAVKADLLRRLGRPAEAAVAYEAALALTENAAERAFLESRLQPDTPDAATSGK
jgi:RNA polymerase sigma-70 factor, ECF subfamily